MNDARIGLIKKMDKNYEPSEKELKNAYGYLDYCFCCGRSLLPFEAFSHGFDGNCHKFGCSILARFIGCIYGFFSFLIKLVLAIIISPFYFVWKLIKKVLTRIWIIN